MAAGHGGGRASEVSRAGVYSGAMRVLGAVLFATIWFVAGGAGVRGVEATAGGKVVSKPLYRDPPFDAPTDPVFCYNAEEKKWLMYYTARRAAAGDAPGVTWIHGTNIGMAESSDGGATWTYRGTADIRYGKDVHPKDYTYWAPEVIWHAGTYHMFLSYVPGIFTDWNHPREIV